MILERRRVGRTAVLHATLLAMCMGCGGAAEPPPQEASASAGASQPIDPCVLVTQEDASEAVGAAVGGGERPPEANISPVLATCRYVGERGQGVAVLTVMVRRGSSPGEARAGFSSMRTTFSDAQSIGGMGDEAFLIGDQLHVLSGTDQLTIGGAIAPDTAQRLARIALDRLD
jgi:hypothetical protein